MKPRQHDPKRLDPAAFAADGAELGGRWPLAGFPRVQDAVAPDAPGAGADVEWSARGEQRRAQAAQPEVWLHLQAHTEVWLQCQRCLQPVSVAVDVDREFRFVHGEDEAASLDAEIEEDVLELTRSLDLQGLIEDEVLLALPVVPRHERCPTVLPTSVAAEPEAQAPNPFAVLEALKNRRP